MLLWLKSLNGSFRWDVVNTRRLNYLALCFPTLGFIM
jgi:hypothetical protein